MYLQRKLSLQHVLTVQALKHVSVQGFYEYVVLILI